MSAQLDDLNARIATNTLTTLQQAALTTALTAISPFFPSPDDSASADAPPDVLLAREWIAALYAIQATAGGVIPVPPTTLTTVPNLAALAALSTVSLADGSQAYVQTVGAYYSLESLSALAPDGITIIAAAGGGNWLRGVSAISEQAVQQLTWFVDAQNASGFANDENTGLTALTPLVHKAEIARRWGSWSAVLNVAVVVTYLSADSTGAGTGKDPALFAPIMASGGSFRQTAAFPAAAFTGTLLAVTAKTVAGNGALSSTFTPTTGAIAAKMILVNATRGNSRAIAVRDKGGGNWLLTQPLAPYVPPAVPSPTEVDTWANGDAISGFVPLTINVPVIGGEMEFGPFTPGHTVERLTIVEPTAPTTFFTCHVKQTAAPVIVDCVFARSPNVEPGGTNLGVGFLGCDFDGFECPAGNGTTGYVAGGVIRQDGGSNIIHVHDFALGQDVVVAGQVRFMRSTFAQGTPVSASIYVDTGASLNIIRSALLQTGGKIYGPGTLNAVGAFSYTDAAATTIPIAVLALNGVATGYSNVTAAGVTTVHGGIALSAANLDAAAGAAGFGGYAFGGGGTFSKAGVQP